MSIYTKKGDKGETGLFSSDRNKKIRVLKSSQIIKTIGAIDEVNSYIGVVVSQCEDNYLKEKLTAIQSDLLTIGSIIAGSSLRLNKLKVAVFEKEIDELDKELSPLKNFILPGGTKTASELQFLRSLVRRAERELVTLNDEKSLPPNVTIYLNRLSDYVYTLARYENFRNQFADVIWKT